MSLRHLTDNEIQDYLDGAFAHNGRHISDHLEGCHYCQGQLRQYQSIFHSLKNDIAVKLSPAFSENVVARLTDEPEKSFRIGFLYVVLSVVSLIAGLGTTLFLTGIQPLLNVWSLVTKIGQAVDFEWLTPIARFLSGLNLDLSLLGFALFVVAVISLVDYVLLRPRHKVASFFKMTVI